MMKFLFVLALIVVIFDYEISCKTDFNMADFLSLLYKSNSRNRNLDDFLNGKDDTMGIYEDIEEYNGNPFDRRLRLDDNLATLLQDDDSYPYQVNHNNNNLNDDDDDDEGEDDYEENNQESENHGSLVGGYQFMSGGAGEGKQHLKPNGQVPNKEEIKSDMGLPAYCEPPNPCPVGYKHENCDPRPYSEFTAEYSKTYQESQNCMCDSDHNVCSGDINGKHLDGMLDNVDFLPVVAKKSPRVKRGARVDKNDDSNSNNSENQHPLLFHVAKKFSKF